MVEFPPDILKHPDIIILIAKWEGHYNRKIYGMIEMEKDENGTIIKRLPYYDCDFVRDLLIKIQRLIDDENKQVSRLLSLKNKLEE